MELPALKKRKWSYVGIAFLLPFLGMLIVMLAGQRVPFGHYSMLYSDMYHQYFPFFVDFRRMLREGNGLVYNWALGMGMDYLGLYAYYLASPLNLLGVLVPEGLLLEYFSFLVPIKLGCAGMFFAIFLKRTFRKNDLSISLFGAFYALCAWALGYQWNVMWLDTFALLPLVVLGEVELLRDKRFVLYTVTLFFSIIINYYIGLFTCIFVFLLFFCYEICRWRGFGRFFADLFRIACFSLLAIGMTAILELPALAALSNTQSSVNEYPKKFELNITSDDTWRGLFDAMRQAAGNMSGGLSPTFKEGLPNLYCGVGTLLLAFLYLTARKVRFRDKLCCVALLVFFMVSFIVRKLDYIWHGMHFTNMMPYRFSFLFSFVMLYMAYRAFLMRRRFRPWQLIIAGALTALVMACSDERGSVVFIVYNAAFLAIYFAILLRGILRERVPAELTGERSEEPDGEADGVTAGETPEETTGETVKEATEGMSEESTKVALRDWLRGRAHRKKIVSALLAGVLGLELVAALVNFGVSFPLVNISDYPKGTVNTAAAVDQMKEREGDGPFYRAEVTHTQTLNDSALIGYNGITSFTSSANMRATLFMRAIGYAARDVSNRYIFEEGSPVTNLFLDLKYMVDRESTEKANEYFTEVYRAGGVRLLENRAWLPLGFLTDAALGDVDFTKNPDPFDFQNDILTAASGVEERFWRHIPTQNMEVTATDGIETSVTPSSRYCTYTTGSQSGTVTYSFTADRAGLLCVYVSFSSQDSFRILKNGETLVSESYSLPQILSVCHAEPGDVFEISRSVKANLRGSMTIRAAVLNEEAFWDAYDVLSASTLQIDSLESTRVEGTIDCDRDGLLYTSIPYDGNWSATVDGVPTEPVLIGNCMIALPVTKGVHRVVYQYHNAALSFGWKVSLLCVCLFAAAVAVSRFRSRRRRD